MTSTQDFFNKNLNDTDAAIFNALEKELNRQKHQLELIASENIVSKAVLQAQGSVLTNKYAEGYPSKRYYGGCEHADEVEDLARGRLKRLFSCSYVNVQPHSGSQANQSVMLALLKPGDTVMGLDLAAGGHLTHGSPVNLSGRWFNIVSYGVDEKTHLIDLNRVREIAKQHQPKLIIAGGSAYPRFIDFKRFREIADEVGAYLMVDMAHFAGLVAGGVYPSPLKDAHVVTSTTHKTLRGPRGGIVLSNDEEIGKKINSAVFPGLQGGPLMHVIAAKAVAFQEALSPDFKDYATQVVLNAKAMAEIFLEKGYDLVSGGTDSHLLLLDLRGKNLNGKQACADLESVGIATNKNGIPFDPLPPTVTSGIRLGTPALTTRRFQQEECKYVASLMDQAMTKTLDAEQLKLNVQELCKRFPIYS